MLKVRFISFFSVVFMLFAMNFAFAEDEAVPVKETYKLQGTIEYDDNPVEVIYLDENIEKPQVNIPKRSLTLPIGVLNITSNVNSQRSALARAMVNRSNLSDILPLSASVAEQIGDGFSYGQIWEQEMSSLAQMQNTTAFFIKYDSPKWYSFTTSIRQATNRDLGTQYNILRLAPEWHITDKLTLKDSFSNYMDQTRNKNELTLIYTPSLRKYADCLKFELGVAQSYYRSGRQTSEVSFSTGFKL
ncbi:MAG: hypothetical protein E7Z89_02145 [Cyanobacteria bacterium SIG28]|nr:hypothetical protein [Cyanobacteria bacterium SIG28]